VSERTNESLPVAQAIRSQRRALLLAGVLVFAGLWIAVGLGEWQVGIFVAVGVLLGLANGILTEAFLMRATESDDMLSRKQFAISSLVRLSGISLVALTLTVAFWPYGGAVLGGLAAFHLMALVLTALPLLKELRQA
jgi:hypothetical protein